MGGIWSEEFGRRNLLGGICWEELGLSGSEELLLALVVADAQHLYQRNREQLVILSDSEGPDPELAKGKGE